METAADTYAEIIKIGENIKNRREEIGMPQVQLAADVGISQQALWRAETGHRLPSLIVMMKIADALGCTLNDIAYN